MKFKYLVVVTIIRQVSWSAELEYDICLFCKVGIGNNTFLVAGGDKAISLDPLGVSASNEKRPRHRRTGLDSTNKTSAVNSNPWGSNDSIEATSTSTVMGSRNNSRPSIGQESVQLRLELFLLVKS